MTETTEHNSDQTIAVIGSGPVGVYFVNELSRLGFAGQVLLFGDEPHAPYNRVQLSSLLDGSSRWAELIYDVYLKPDWQSFYHTRIDHIDRAGQCLMDQRGEKYRYDRLVLATGSRPHIPSIPGTHLKGVFAFRNMDDANQLLSRQVSSRHTVVVGGGLLGIETARAMAKYGTRVTLIHHSPILMNRQLDEAASALLIEELSRLGVEVLLSTAVLNIEGRDKVETVTTRDKTPLPCDTVIFATGIKPNLELARDADLAVGQGVKVDEHLHTSAPYIYAIGECAEFNDRIFGLVAPGFEQAGVLARNLCSNRESASYRESLLSASLKVVEMPVFSTGEVGQDYEEGFYRNLVHHKDGIYRKLVLSRGRLVGAIGLGGWPEQELLKDAIAKKQYISPLRRILFKLQGALFSDSIEPERLPASAIICNCRQIPAETIRACVAGGCESVDTIGSQCGAGTVCGSCQPLLAAFTAQDVKPVSQRWLAGWGAIMGLIIAAFFLLPPLSISPTYNPAALDRWWTQTDYRQITGFTMLGLMTTGLLVALRKRLRWFRWLKFDKWRWFHVILSSACIAILFVHTGLGDIQGLNFWLLSSFMAAGLMGVATSVFTHLESAKPGIANKTVKRWFTAAHLVTFWPFPILLGLHILTVYWF